MEEKYKKLIILILNFCTCGFGTIISPFILNGECSCRKVFVAIIYGLLQVLHFVNIISMIFGFKFIKDFYDIIGGENILKPFMSDKYKEFSEMANEVSEKIPPNDVFKIEPPGILSMDQRVYFLKIFLLLISGISYINSNLSPIIDLIKEKDLDFKMLTYGVFNPGAGMFISGILFFNNEGCKTIISLIGVIIGILLMFCPFILGIGLYLMKIVKNILNFYLVKIIITSFGFFATIFSLIFSFLQNNLDKNDKKKQKNIFDIDCKFAENKENYEIKSHFGIGTIIRIIANIILPGSGIFSLACKYGCDDGVFITGFVHIFSGLIFIYTIFYLIFKKREDYDYEQENKYEQYLFVYSLFTINLINHYCGALIIFISDYFPKKPKNYDGLGALIIIILNLLSGGYGNLIIISIIFNYCEKIIKCTESKCCREPIVKSFFSILGIICHQLMLLSFIMNFHIIAKIIFSVAYGGFTLFYLLVVIEGIKKNNNNNTENIPRINSSSNINTEDN